uniref:Transmembrane and coiled-coil domains 6 n=1 Tax=Oryzias sinensis TaxID=183150 RepID=A0A8C7XF30_9TELE
MWRLNKIHHKSRWHQHNIDELRLRRREQERALRQARRDRQLVSKRLLLYEEEEQTGVTMETASGEQDVVSLLLKLQRGGTEKEIHLKALSKVLRESSAQLSFIKQENSMHLLVGLLTGSDAQCRLLAVRCLHELSYSPNTSVASACMAATPYLLTFLSGPTTKFTETCLYTLGNLCPVSEAVKEKLLAQGIIPALASCMENQRHNLAVVEAIGFTLSQLLQATGAIQKIISMVMCSSLPTYLVSFLTPDSEFGLGAAIECAWCLHYLVCSSEDHQELLARGALLHCSAELVSLSGAVTQGHKEDGMELLVCPLLRIVGNLLPSCLVEDLDKNTVFTLLVDALCVFLQAYLSSSPSLARETAWVLNNLTAHSTECCSAVVTLNLVSPLIQLLPVSHGINTMVLRILANIVSKKKELCVQLVQLGLLSALCSTLKMADQEMVTLSLDVLYMLLLTSPQVKEEFLREGGASILEIIQYNDEGEIRRKASYLVDQLLLTQQQHTV